MIEIENFGITTSPTPLTNAQRSAAYGKSGKGRVAKQRYESAQYLKRPFIMWDGEGVTGPDGEHIYNMLSSSEGDYITDPKGLRTYDIFMTILDRSEKDKRAIHVVYGASYDWNMFMTDISQSSVEKLYETGAVYWNVFKISWRRGKSFRIADRVTNRAVLIYDVVSFFQCAFVKACDDYLGDRFVEREMIVASKVARGTFTNADAKAVKYYNDMELVNGVNLMNELRIRLDRVGLRPARWDGPGAIAVALLKREDVPKAMAECPPDIKRAGRYAYAGGRFEVIRMGDVTGKAYEYDINSAYPAALRHLPNLADGEWVQSDSTSDTHEFGVYSVVWESDDRNLLRPHPFFARKPDGTVCYPPKVSGWYWAPEIVAAQRYAERYGGKLRILQGWKFIPANPEDKPFGFIDGMYLKRQALKKAGDGAHVGIKLGLNSLYGKTCQKVGAKLNPETGEWRIPPFHQLEWAGWVTSHCRATIFTAALEDLDSIIAFETDALFSMKPLNVKVGTGLGEWEFTEFDQLCYVQSGFYFGNITRPEKDAGPFSKTRGVDRGSMRYADIVEGLAQPVIANRVARAKLTRFIGVGLARQLNDWARWQRWETNPKAIKLEPQGKRIHEWCPECGTGGLKPGVWHYTYPPFSQLMNSVEYPIPWINPNPDMLDIEDFAEMHREDMAADYE